MQQLPKGRWSSSSLPKLELGIHTSTFHRDRRTASGQQSSDVGTVRSDVQGGLRFALSPSLPRDLRFAYRYLEGIQALHYRRDRERTHDFSKQYSQHVDYRTSSVYRQS